MEKLVAIAGPTGSGKSIVSIAVSRNPDLPPCEIISADSRQVYRGMDIGTDKISSGIRADIPHHLIDIMDPDTPYSAAAFSDMASEIITRITVDKGLPLVVGGTGLYLRLLLRGVADVPSGHPEIRAVLREEAETRGVDTLYAELMQRDPVRGEQIDPHDQFRIIRALEILRSGHENISDSFKKHGFETPHYRARIFVLSVPRPVLYKRIEQRIDGMVEAGLVNEVRAVLDRWGESAPALTGIGYRQIVMYLKGKISFHEAIRLTKRDTRRFAKRQLTWFRKEQDVSWLEHNPENTELTVQTITDEIKTFWGLP